MQVIHSGSKLHHRMQAWRRDFHAHPETAFEEHLTSAKVAELLTSFGLQVHTGLAGTGVVGTLAGRYEGDGAIGLRADMDALAMEELNCFEHRSKFKGKMHACGHDGHTAMLLGAASYLADNREFAGTVHFIFQPAEEGEAGARVMCEEGMFERFPVDAVYGMHNWPGLEAGSFAVHQGAVMASMDVFDIHIQGRGAHGGMPHLGIDPVLVAGHLMTSLHSIVGRFMDPLESGVVSITRIHAGDAYNVIPDKAVLSGTCRALSEATRGCIENRMELQVDSVCSAFGAKGILDYRRIYPATVNAPSHSELCIRTAERLVGSQQVSRRERPSMGAEDFAFMLQERPGAYIWIGNGSASDGKGLHNPYYDFNDEILSLGASFWVQLVQTCLPR